MLTCAGIKSRSHLKMPRSGLPSGVNAPHMTKEPNFSSARQQHSVEARSNVGPLRNEREGGTKHSGFSLPPLRSFVAGNPSPSSSPYSASTDQLPNAAAGSESSIPSLTAASRADVYQGHPRRANTISSGASTSGLGPSPLFASSSSLSSTRTSMVPSSNSRPHDGSASPSRDPRHLPPLQRRTAPMSSAAISDGRSAEMVDLIELSQPLSSDGRSRLGYVGPARPLTSAFYCCMHLQCSLSLCSQQRCVMPPNNYWRR